MQIVSSFCIKRIFLMCLDKNLLKTSQSVTLIRIQCFIICYCSNLTKYRIQQHDISNLTITGCSNTKCRKFKVLYHHRNDTEPETVPQHQHVTKPGIMRKYERCQVKIHLSHLQLCSWTAVNWSNQTHRTQVVSKLPFIWTQPHLNASRLAFSIRPAQTSSCKLSDVTPT